MSRVGQLPVDVPDGVTVDVAGQLVKTKGKLGQLSMQFAGEIDISSDGNQVSVKQTSSSVNARKMWGTARSVIANMVVGVSEGYTKKLEINGVGYRAQVKGNDLVLQVGYSHEVNHPIPEGIKITCADQTHIEIQGVDKQKVGQTAAVIRAYRPPEPYKGKGIKYADEIILRKEGKKK
jgi:large subunit ribosomal protein L6